MPRARKATHLVDRCRMRHGEPSWSLCDCGERIEAATPDELVDATRAHRKAAGLYSSGQQRSGDKWDGSFTAAAW